MSYEDERNGVDKIERQFIIKEGDANHKFQEVIFAKKEKPYRYQAKYFMADGKEFETDWKEGESEVFYLEDPFNDTKIVNIYSVEPDFINTISVIYADFNYRDNKNDYAQTTSVVLNKNQYFTKWKIPVIDGNIGITSYTAKIVYQDGSIEDIPETKMTDNQVIFQSSKAKRGVLEVEILSDLIDFDEVKLVRSKFIYRDEANDVLERKSFIFKPTDTDSKKWAVEIKDKNKLSYEWEATFYMIDGSRHSVGPITEDTDALLLEVPETV